MRTQHLQWSDTDYWGNRGERRLKVIRAIDPGTENIHSLEREPESGEDDEDSDMSEDAEDEAFATTVFKWFRIGGKAHIVFVL